MKRVKTIALAFVLIGVGCAGNLRPNWAQSDKKAFLQEQTFYGVGQASSVNNQFLAQMTAESLARSEAEKLLNDYATLLMHHYTNALSPKEREKLEARQNLIYIFRTYVTMAMFDATVDRTWTDTEKEMVHALVKLKLRFFIEKLRQSDEVDADLRKFIKENAKATFDRFVEQQEKRS